MVHTFESPVSHHPPKIKCEELKVAYGRWSLARKQSVSAGAQILSPFSFERLRGRPASKELYGSLFREDFRTYILYGR